MNTINFVCIHNLLSHEQVGQPFSPLENTSHWTGHVRMGHGAEQTCPPHSFWQHRSPPVQSESLAQSEMQIPNPPATPRLRHLPPTVWLTGPGAAKKRQTHANMNTCPRVWTDLLQQLSLLEPGGSKSDECFVVSNLSNTMYIVHVCHLHKCSATVLE